MAVTERITKNLGGDRLGSGNKNNISMHAYNRSTHDLSRAWRSSMNVGTLVPCLVEPALPGDTFSMDIKHIVRTVPALGPLYGSYKFQVDVFTAPIRLYNGLLHNNMQKIGLNMSQVVLPKMNISTKIYNPNKFQYDINTSQLAKDSLLNYLGLNGFGDVEFEGKENYKAFTRKFNAVPLLAYWDIYKNYYANKQEETGYFICPSEKSVNSTLKGVYVWQSTDQNWVGLRFRRIPFYEGGESVLPPNISLSTTDYQEMQLSFRLQEIAGFWYDGVIDTTTAEVVLHDTRVNTYHVLPFSNVFDVYNTQNVTHGHTLDVRVNRQVLESVYPDWINLTILGIGYNGIATNQSNIEIKDFPLDNLDTARIEILRNTGLNNEFLVNVLPSPYMDIVATTTDGRNLGIFSQMGLALKTYQADLFNNWLKTEWIDGVGGINQITAIDTSTGSFTIDALNLANKVYNMLNRIAVSGGSYEDYIEAVYSTDAMRRAESPVYCGGFASEIVFEEVVSTSANLDEPLGTLAGKGTASNDRGGKLEIKVKEPSFIIAICSITPRIDYSQGNKWFLTELDTMDDLHKPALDGIGFEDLLQERMAFWGTYYDTNYNLRKLATGKVPAWVNYMSTVNETHGDFAVDDKTMYMTLNRRYEYIPNMEASTEKGIKDMTTYIDPTKYNYNFADASLASQNFWVQLGFKVIARRVMSAKIMPNL